MFVAYSCKQRCTCPSCHQKRTLMTGIHVAEDVCFPVAHRQVVFTIPKRLRVHARFDRKLLGKLSSCAWACIKAEARRPSESGRCGARHDCGDSDTRNSFALEFPSPLTGFLRCVHT
jgi:hypothetical protein